MEWIPRLPIDYDCGPGCEQIIDESADSYASWDVQGRYLSYSPEYDEGVRVIDLETHCFLRIYHPEFTGWLTTFRYPSIDGENVAFMVEERTYDYFPCKAEIFLLDLKVGEHRRFLASESSTGTLINHFFVDLKGELLAVVSGTSDSKSQMMLYDWTLDSLLPVSDPETHVTWPNMSGDYLAWTEVTDGQWDIFVHRLSSSETWNLTDHPARQLAPRINDQRMVWTDMRNWEGDPVYNYFKHADIFMYDFSTEEITAITNQEWIQSFPDISGDRVVWQDSRDCDDPVDFYDRTAIHIWMYDLSTEQEHQITSLSGSQTEARIEGDRVFFRSAHPDGDDVLFVQALGALDL